MGRKENMNEIDKKKSRKMSKVGETGRQKDGQTDRVRIKTDRSRQDKYRDIQIDGDKYRQTDRETELQTQIHKESNTDKETDRKQTDREVDIQTDRPRRA